MMKDNFYENRIKNPTIRANSPVASANANPRIEYENSCPLNEGFLETALIRAAKTIPIPTPAPHSPIEASPAPINLAAWIIEKIK